MPTGQINGEFIKTFQEINILLVKNILLKLKV